MFNRKLNQPGGHLEIKVEDYYLRYGPMVLRRCRKLLKDEAKAADAMQETFVNLMTHQAKLMAHAPSSLLYRIATNICLNLIRSENYQNANPKLIEIATAIDPSSGWISKNLLSQIFANQKESTAYICILFYLDGMTLEEIASEVGMSVSGVRKRIAQVKLTATEYKEGA